VAAGRTAVHDRGVADQTAEHSAGQSAGQSADRTARHLHRRLEPVARTGYAVSGALHVLIGYLAVRVALGSSSGSADQSGALAQVARSPGGAVLLWAAAVALAVLALEEVLEAVLALRPPGRDAKEAASGAGKAVVFAVLALTAARFASGGSSSSERSSDGLSARLMGSPGGAVLVAAVGVGVLAVAAFHVHKGVTSGFREDLRMPTGAGTGRGVLWAGRVGYTAKGVALGVVGVLFVLAAVRSDPREAGGLDAGLRTLASAPFGAVLLVLVGVGLAAFGLYSFVRARRGQL
jgi:Domain of Unknown Function (DUF1206)